MAIKKKTITFKKFFQILIVSISLFILLAYIFDKYIFYQYFLKNIDKQNYYNALYGTGDIGCKTLKIINPDVIFIGDSSGYHNWDLGMVGKETNLKIGSCFLPGFSIHSINILTDFLKSIKIKPKIIILSYNYRTFAKNEGKGFSNQHQKILSNIEKNQIQYNFKLFLRKIRGKNFFDITYPDNLEIKDFLDSKINMTKINKLVEKIINENLETSGYKNYKTMISKIDSIEITEKVNLLNNFCDYINNTESKIILVKIPSSVYLEKKLVGKLKSDLILKNYLKKCSKQKYFEKDIINFKNKNKYFILNQYDQNNFEKLKKYLNNNDVNKYHSNFYDFTHMNRLGAKNFSIQWINENIDLFKNENK